MADETVCPQCHALIGRSAPRAKVTIDQRTSGITFGATFECEDPGEALRETTRLFEALRDRYGETIEE